MDDENEEIILKKYFNIGVATDTPEGLMVPVVKNAKDKSILHLAQELTLLVEKARNRTIDLADLKGGTFTISNYGALGGIYATPIINYPEVARDVRGWRVFSEEEVSKIRDFANKLIPPNPEPKRKQKYKKAIGGIKIGKVDFSPVSQGF